MLRKELLMTLPTIPWRFCSRFLRGKALGHIVGWLCGGVTLSWVASQAGPQTGTAIVHVTEPHVAVSVDGRLFHVGEAIYVPLVCDLAAGEHRITMTRGTDVLYAANFSIEGGEELVLTTWRVPKAAVGGPSRSKSILDDTFAPPLRQQPGNELPGWKKAANGIPPDGKRPEPEG
jgi:hypothetical protein